MRVWRPQAGPQYDAITALFARELLFGGARGGGKSDYLLGDFLQGVNRGTKWDGIIFRKNLVVLGQLIKRSKELFLPLGATWTDQKKTWKFPDGSTLIMAYLEREADADNYQGHEYDWIGWDELGQWASPAGYNKLRACLRGTHDTATPRRIRASANPAGAGHQWIMHYFKIDEYPLGYQPIKHEKTGHVRLFIPSKLQDNKILMRADPNYIAELEATGSPELVRAWLEGDWSVVAGAYFPEFSVDRHIRQPHPIPEHWTKFTAFDWGSAAPFCVLWFAVADGEQYDGVPNYPRGSLVVYREYYGCKEPNVGVKMDAEIIASTALAMENDGERITYRVADPAIFSKDSGPSIGERMARAGMSQRKADNKRLLGWDQIRHRLVGSNKSEGEPLLYVFSTCKHLIRTLPSMQHDEKKPEDLDTEAEDHAVDTLRYGCMSRHIVRDAPQEPQNVWEQKPPTINELIKESARLRQQGKL